MPSTTQETPKIVAPFWESLLTGFAVGVVAGIGVGVVATSKDAIPTIAAAAAGVGVATAATYFVVDYRHTSQRNTLRHTLTKQFAQTEGERHLLQKQLQQSNATISQLQADLQAANAKYDLLADTADTEVQRLRALVPADAISADTPTHTDSPIEPPASSVTAPPATPATAEPATVS